MFLGLFLQIREVEAAIRQRFDRNDLEPCHDSTLGTISVRIAAKKQDFLLLD
jgi:hypothetical protein